MLMLTALSTWWPPPHQAGWIGLPQVSATRGVTLRQLVRPSSKMLQLILSFLKIAFTLQPREDLKSYYSNLLEDWGKLLFDSLYRLCVVAVLVTELSQTKGQVISRWEAIQSSSRRVRLMQSRLCPQIFCEAPMVWFIFDETQAGYLGIEWERKTPFAEAVLKAMNPLAWADDELVSPVGFSSFQATCSRA